MRRVLKLILPLVLMTAVPSLASGIHEAKEVARTPDERQEPGSVSPGALDVVAAFHDALEAGDGEEALSYLAPEVVILESGGSERSRAEYASHHLPGDMRFAGMADREVIEQREHILGDSRLVLTWTRSTGAVGDRQIDSNGVETMVLGLFDGQWKIIHIHWSSRSNTR